jgi:hypothetical protein
MYHLAKHLKTFLGMFGSTGIDSTTDSARDVDSDVDAVLDVDEDVDSGRDVPGDAALDVNEDIARLYLGCEDDVAPPYMVAWKLA